MTLNVLHADGRPCVIAQPGREHTSDDDALLSFLALQLMDAPSGSYLVTSTDARGAVEAQVGLQVAAPGRDVGERGEQYAWSYPTGQWQTTREQRQARERLVMSARHAVERAEFEATGYLPADAPVWLADEPAPGDPRVGPHDAVTDVRHAAAQFAAGPAVTGSPLCHDLAEGYRSLAPVSEHGHTRAAGSDEAHLAEHFEQLAALDRHTLDERSIAAVLALGQRQAERTAVAREHHDDMVATLGRIETVLDSIDATVAGVDEAARSARVGALRRAWRRVFGEPAQGEPCIAWAGLCKCPECR